MAALRSLLLTLVLSALSYATANSNQNCKVIPGDPTYPTDAQWQSFNRSIGGNLISVVPVTAPCHNTFEGKPVFNADRCETVTNLYPFEGFHADDPSSVMWTALTNRTCILTDDPTVPCTRGYWPRYVANAQCVSDVQATVNFGRTNNLRMIIKNTGHDFNGKSTARGALSIRTHAFQDITHIPKWTGPGNWTGHAFKVGAGVNATDLYNAAHAKGLFVISGECKGVGHAGGYIQGGGHGPGASKFGMAADQILAVEVVTPSGDHVTADASQNQDLLFAFSGGGGGTFGVLISVTIKAFPDLIFSGTEINFNNDGTQKYWDAVQAYYEEAAKWPDLGMYSYYTFSAGNFDAKPILAPGMTKSQLATVLAPLFQKLNTIGIAYNQSLAVISQHSNWLDAYNFHFDDETVGAVFVIGGQLISQSTIRANPSGVAQAYQHIVTAGGFIIGHVVAPPQNVPVNNAVGPKWRQGTVLMAITANFLANNVSATDFAAAENVVTNDWGAALRAVAPNDGVYLNEMDLNEPDWQTKIWGQSNYQRLLKIKQKYDPTELFYVKTGVGSESWTETDGRLCKTS